ncbi:PleD family two-component system response regulator [Methanohalobium sp.]|uniref:response regulator n=1 Tax=Methanohalobium sp. TaxID=2837493 RepID=UPI0025E44F3E|nr:response regulator [Methanohalobium sp.]
MPEPKIIAIDDNLTNLKLIEKLLEDKYNIKCFQDAMEALAYLKDHQADLILSDLMMPGMTGIDLLKQIHSQNLPIPLIIISAYDNQQYIEQAYYHGALKYIIKPINPDELFEEVDSSLTLNP